VRFFAISPFPFSLANKSLSPSQNFFIGGDRGGREASGLWRSGRAFRA
jgi:hypothetical protein